MIKYKYTIIFIVILIIIGIFFLVNYDSSNLNYIVDSKQSVSVNSNWLPESYNEIFKQLMVSDEIYWVEKDSSNSIIPLTISTQNITFKTGVNDKLIQYQFDFELGQPYKLIL